MGFLKDLLISGTAYKAFKQSNPPSLVPSPEIVIVGLKHKGFGNTWQVKYKMRSSMNVIRSITLSKNTTRVSIGSHSIDVNWN